MILNNATNSAAEWKISNAEDSIQGAKGEMSWGTVVPPRGPFDYSATFTGPEGTASVNGINNPDACLTYTGTEILVTYPGA